MSTNETDDDGHALNRHASDAKISALEFFKATGWPVFRLSTQFRMVNGLFSLSHDLFYTDLPFVYAAQCSTEDPAHAIGKRMERFLVSHFPSLKPSPQGQQREVFLHCPGTSCTKDVNGSKSNREQVDIAMALLNLFVDSNPGVNAADIGIISPYKANVQAINKETARCDGLKGINDAATVEAYQGCEAGVVVLIMCTTQESGPGFTADPRRLK
jgi:superfamily I DNA and/or RNA helicase